MGRTSITKPTVKKSSRTRNINNVSNTLNLDQNKMSNVNGISLLASVFFDGEGQNPEFFFRQFEDVSDLMKWSPLEKITILKSRLRGNALQLVLSDGELIQSQSYSHVKDTLLKFFSEEIGLGECQLQFNNCKQWEGEPVKNFAHRVIIASNKYLGTLNGGVNTLAEDVLDKMRLSKFLSASLPAIQTELIKLNPQTFQQAIDNAKRIQLSLEFSKKVSVNALQNNEGNLELRDINKDLKHKVEELTMMVNALKTNNDNKVELNFREKENDQKCLLCGESHLVKDCEVYFNLMSVSETVNGNARGQFTNTRGHLRGNNYYSFRQQNTRPFVNYASRGQSNNRGRRFDNSGFRGRSQFRSQFSDRENFDRGQMSNREETNHFLVGTSETHL
jgi:hypothetical protein